MRAITRTILTPVLSGKKNGEPFQRPLNGVSMAAAQQMLALLEGEEKEVKEMYVQYEISLAEFFKAAEIKEFIDPEIRALEKKKKLDAIHASEEMINAVSEDFMSPPYDEETETPELSEDSSRSRKNKKS